MNKELDKLLCGLDGKITIHRQNNNDDNPDLILIQTAIQYLWTKNKEE